MGGGQKAKLAGENHMNLRKATEKARELYKSNSGWLSDE